MTPLTVPGEAGPRNAVWWAVNDRGLIGGRVARPDGTIEGVIYDRVRHRFRFVRVPGSREVEVRAWRASTDAPVVARAALEANGATVHVPGFFGWAGIDASDRS